MGVYEELQARGLIAQVTNEEEIRDVVNNGKAVFYIGFDCTADSLTAGHFMALTLMKRLQMAGNKSHCADWRRHHDDWRPLWPDGYASRCSPRRTLSTTAECFRRQMETLY